MAETTTASSISISSIANRFKFLAKYGDIAFALAIMGILMVLLFPVPPLFLDLLLAFSITTGVIILMTCLFISKPLEFSVFPTVLLVTAILRLALNIASTRLILSQGHTGTAAAGHVIEAFGSFVMSGNVVIGAIVFIILTIINFVVITKGSGRIAEVAARFSLDAMPGKQMAIDADLSAGLIDEPTAKARRKEIEDESTFFGSMDGANKFVRGDAIAGLLITFINFVAGIIIGVVQRDLSFHDALHTYTTLTIGDGLVAQIPSLIISLSAGLLVSKSGVVGSTEKAIFGQLSRHPQALWLGSFLMLLMASMPGIPAAPFTLISTMLAAIAWSLKTKSKEQAIQSDQQKVKEQATAKPAEEPITETLQIDSIRLELGYSLLPIINYQKGHRLTDQIKALRKQMAKDLGFIMPSIRIQDNMQLPNNTYVIKIKDIECGKGQVRPDMLLVMDPKGEEITLAGEVTKEPAFGLPAKWVAENSREEASFRNYTVVDPPTVITTHLTEIIKDNITELLTYSETTKLLDEINESHKKLVSDTIPSQISISGIQRVLQNLLSEMVSIRDLPTIMEAISEASRNNNNINNITEYVRSRLSRQISFSQVNSDGVIPVISLSPAWEQVFTENIVGNGDDKQLSIPPNKLHDFILAVRKSFDEQAVHGHMPVLLVSPGIRPYVRSLVERFRSVTVVMSQSEVHPKSKIKTLAQI
jgi:flagellar biosynthesis protein FlhA